MAARATTTLRLQDVYQQAYSGHLNNARISRLYATTTRTGISKATTASQILPTNVSSFKDLPGDSSRTLNQVGQAALGQFASLLVLLWFGVFVPLFYVVLYVTVCVGTVYIIYQICNALGPDARRQLHQICQHGSIRQRGRTLAQRASQTYNYYRWHRTRDEALNRLRTVDRMISNSLAYLLLLVPAFLLMKAACFPSAGYGVIPWNELEGFEIPWHLRIEKRQFGSNHMAPAVHHNTGPSLFVVSRYEKPEIAIQPPTTIEAAEVTLASTHTEYLITTVFKTVQGSTTLESTCPSASPIPISES
ncbi:hypothetical protein HII31_02224 [Pseudocercospora fuligena]|uniref:Uncharacterized protein n=1 Tax=Pseudocercospora fuligena TaxID=685502 RepID=A0A8H6RSU3_9PEZI|nr:hypothetical protein HII31_02224 [Pseudocercospora fuligena]